uniref:MIT_C domain-containing protein n=1 Tax=Steinernema glaseri TaxID=37863 RepID=A0A1I7ZSM6_9BILA
MQPVGNKDKLGDWLHNCSIDRVDFPVNPLHDFTYESRLGEWLTNAVTEIEMFEPYVFEQYAPHLNLVHRANMISFFSLVSENTKCTLLKLVTKTAIPPWLKAEFKVYLPYSMFDVIVDPDLHDRRIKLSTNVEIISGRGTDWFRFNHKTYYRMVRNPQTGQMEEEEKNPPFFDDERPTMACVIDVVKKSSL